MDAERWRLGFQDEEGVVAHYVVHGAQQILGRLALGDEATSAGLLGCLGERFQLVHGKHQDRCLRGGLKDTSRGFQAVHHGHGEIHNNEIGTQFVGFANGFFTVGSLTANFNVAARFKDTGHSFSYGFVIVGNQNAQVRHEQSKIITARECGCNVGLLFASGEPSQKGGRAIVGLARASEDGRPPAALIADAAGRSEDSLPALGAT
jgi:hypothetical protein